MGDTLASMWRGSLDGMSLSFVVDELAPVGGRAMAAGAVVGAIGYAVGFAFRSAVGALVTAVAYIGAAEIGVRHLVEGSGSWLAFTNVTAFIRGGLLSFSANSDGTAYTPHVLSVAHAAAVLGTGLFAVGIIASMSVRRDA